jgi:hypothetical protein
LNKKLDINSSSEKRVKKIEQPFKSSPTTSDLKCHGDAITENTTLQPLLDANAGPAKMLIFVLKISL